MNEMVSDEREREESSAPHQKRRFNNRQTINSNYKKMSQLTKGASVSGATQTEQEEDSDM